LVFDFVRAMTLLSGYESGSFRLMIT
jgi:hypothetical protein